MLNFSFNSVESRSLCFQIYIFSFCSLSLHTSINQVDMHRSEINSRLIRKEGISEIDPQSSVYILNAYWHIANNFHKEFYKVLFMAIKVPYKLPLKLPFDKARIAFEHKSKNQSTWFMHALPFIFLKFEIFPQSFTKIFPILKHLITGVFFE